jgi:hypothetical protein
MYTTLLALAYAIGLRNETFVAQNPVMNKFFADDATYWDIMSNDV